MKIKWHTPCFLLFLIGCKAQIALPDNEAIIFNDEQLNRKYSETIAFNLKNEPELLEAIKSFKNKNSNEGLEDLVIADFLALQICVNEAGLQFRDYPNEFQWVFDFYSTLDKKKLEWLNSGELNILKFISIKFMVKHPNEIEAIEHLKEQLKHCKEDKEYARLVMSSSDLSECIEKRN